MTDNILDNLEGSRIPTTPPEFQYDTYNPEAAKASEVGIDNFFVAPQELKEATALDRAVAAKDRALERLNNNASLDDSYTDLGGGWLEHNGNKLWNDLSDHEMQSVLAHAVAERTLKEQEDGTRLDEEGNPYTGKARRNYNFGTKSYSDSVTKYGSSRGDLDSADPRYVEGGIVKGKRYGWGSGPMGVDTDHKGLDVLYREDEGNMLEYLIQGRKNALEGRTVKGTVEDAQLREQYGDGWSEYYNSPEALFGKKTEVDLELGRKLFDQYLAKYRELKNGNKQQTPSSTVTSLDTTSEAAPKQSEFVNVQGLNKWLGQRESSNDYRAVNQLGYLGKYQFGGAALQDLGYKDSKGNWTGKNGIKNKQDFLGSPKVQEDAQVALLQRNLEYLEAKGATDYIGTEFKGVPVTEEGLLAASHLVGAGAVSQMLRTGVVPEDANGTSALDYMKAGSGLQSDATKEAVTDATQEVVTDAADSYRQRQREWLKAQGKDIPSDSSFGNTIKGFGATFVSELLVNPLDALGDATGWYDFGDEEEKSKAVNDAFGYDPKVAHEAMERVGAQWDIVADSDASIGTRMRAAGNGILEAVVTPELLGTSLGAVMAWVTPGSLFKLAGAGSKYAEAAEKIDFLVKAGKVSRTAGLQQKAKRFMELDGAKGFLAAQSGFATAAMGNINNQYEEFVANNNGVELEGTDKVKWLAERFAVQMFNQNLDKIVDFNIIKNPGMLKGLGPVVKSMTDKEFGKVVTGMTKGFAVTMANMGAEAGQEYAQTMMELYNSRHGSEKFKDVEGFIDFLTHEDNVREAGIASLAGAGGAVQFEAMGTVSGLVGKGLQNAAALKENKQSPETSDPTPDLPPTIVEEEPDMTEEQRTETKKAAYDKATQTLAKYGRLFSAKELQYIVASESTEDENLIDVPSFRNSLLENPAEYTTAFEDIEYAESVIEGRQGTDDANDDDGIALKALRKAKREVFLTLMSDKSHPTLGSGMTPEDVLEEYYSTAELDTKGDPIFDAEAEALVEAYADDNDIPKLRLNSIKNRAVGVTAEQVHDDIYGDGDRSAVTYKRALRNLVNTPNVSRKDVGAMMDKVDHFLNSQVNRKKAFDAAMAKAKANNATYNQKVVTEGRTITGTKAFTDNLPVEGYPDSYIKIEKTPSGRLRVGEASKNISKSIQDNIDYLGRIKTRYGRKVKEVLGQEYTRPASGISVRPAKDPKAETERQTDRSFYKKRKVSKVILGNRTEAWWAPGSDYHNDNKSLINTTSYTADDVVVVHDIGDKFAKFGVLKKELGAAKKAGATVVLDRAVNKNSALYKEVANYFYRAEDEDGNVMFFTKERADKLNAKRDQEKKTKKDEETAKGMYLKFKYLEEFKDLYKATPESLSKAQQAELKGTDKALIPYFSGDKTKKSPTEAIEAFYSNTATKQAEDMIEELSNILRNNGVDSEAFSLAMANYENRVQTLSMSPEAFESGAKAIAQFTDNLSKGRELLGNWHTAIKEVKQGVTQFADWVKEHVSTPKQQAQNMIDSAKGKGRKPTYAYYHPEKREMVTVGTDKTKATSAAKKFGTYIHRMDLDPSEYVEVNKVTPLNSLAPDQLAIDGEEGIIFNRLIPESLALLENTLDKPNTKRGTSDNSILPLVNSPAASLIFDGDLKANPNMALALNIAGHTFLRNSAYLLKNTRKSKETLAEVLGMEEFQITQEVMDLVGDKGMLYKTAANSIGKDVAALMGLARKSNSDVDKQAYDALVADLGQTALLMLVQAKDHTDGLLKTDNSVPAAAFAETVLKKGKGAVTDGNNAKVLFLQLAEGSEDILERIAETTDLIHEVLPEADPSRKEPRLYHSGKRHAKATEGIRKELLGLKIPKEAKDTMKHLMDTEWTADLDMMSDMLKHREDIANLMGYIPVPGEYDDASLPEFARYAVLSYEDKQKQEAVNRGIDKEFDEMELLVEGNKDKKSVSLWFDYFFSKNGRFFIDSNTLNPQGMKQLHRFSMQPKSHTGKYTYAKATQSFTHKGKDVTQYMHYAIAQGLGMATDKKDPAKIDEFARIVLKTLNTPAKVAKAKEGFLKDGKYIVGKAKTAEGKPKYVIEKEHIGHALQAFKLLEDLADKTRKGPVTTAITAEFDAVTSGFGLKLLQMPILKDLKTKVSYMRKWLTKVGIIANDNEILNGTTDTMNRILDGGILDSYQELAKGVTLGSYEQMVEGRNKTGNSVLTTKGDAAGYGRDLWGTLAAIMPQAVEGKDIPSDLRNMFKGPFMTFNYASSIKSIRKALTADMLKNVINSIAKEDFTTEEGKKSLAAELILAYTKQKGDLVKFQHKIRNEALYTVKHGNKRSLETYLSEMIDASYGAQVQTILESQFQPFIGAQDQINSAFGAMFEVFSLEFEDALSAARTKGPVSAEAEKRIYSDLKDKWPMIKGPLTNMETEFEAGVGIYATSTSSPHSVYSGRKPVIANLKSNMQSAIGEDSIRVSHMIKQLASAVSAGSVVPIHYIDGAIMSKTINELSDSGVKGITAIHDAIMPPLWAMGAAQHAYNKQVIKVNTEYSFVDEIMQGIDRVRRAVDVADDRYGSRTVSVKRAGEYQEMKVRDYLYVARNDMKDLANEVNADREKLFTDMAKVGAKVMHMAGTVEGVFSAEAGTFEYTPVAKYREISYTAKKKTVKGRDMKDINTLGKNSC